MSVQVPVIVEPQDPPLPPHPQQLQSTSVPQPPAQSSKSVSDFPMYKNRLQEYTHKTSLQLPGYHTVNEGAQHEPKFRSTVIVDGVPYTSQQTFAQRKSAEQDAARIALENIHQKLKDEGYPVIRDVFYPIIREDNTFCKSILNEYAVKMHLDKPSYQTTQMIGLLPVFVSSVIFNGVSYKGDKGKNKKEAEQLAARVVILSILDCRDSECMNVMCGIIKSKFKLYAAMNKSGDNISICSAATSIVNSQEDAVDELNKRKETEVITSTANLTDISISESLSNELAMRQAAHLPLHHFKRPKPETTMKVIVPPIDLVPSRSEQSVVAPTFEAKRKRKTKKKAKRRLQVCTERSIAMVPLAEFAPSVAL